MNLIFDLDDTLYDMMQPFVRACHTIWEAPLPFDPWALFIRSRRISDQLYPLIAQGKMSVDEVGTARILQAAKELGEDIGEQVNLKDKHPEIVRMLAAKMDSLKQTHVIADKAIFQWEMATDQLTDQQRLDAVLDAKKKGIGPKSKNGEAQLEYYEAKEKFQKGGGSIF